MKIIFTKLETASEVLKISFDGGETWEDHLTKDVKADGFISFTQEQCPDLTKIRIRGKFKTSKNLEISYEPDTIVKILEPTEDIPTVQAVKEYVDESVKNAGALSEINESSTLTPTSQLTKYYINTANITLTLEKCEGIGKTVSIIADVATTVKYPNELGTVVTETMDEGTVISLFFSKLGYISNTYGAVCFCLRKNHQNYPTMVSAGTVCRFVYSR